MAYSDLAEAVKNVGDCSTESGMTNRNAMSIPRWSPSSVMKILEDSIILKINYRTAVSHVPLGNSYFCDLELGRNVEEGCDIKMLDKQMTIISIHPDRMPRKHCKLLCRIANVKKSEIEYADIIGKDKSKVWSGFWFENSYRERNKELDDNGFMLLSVITKYTLLETFSLDDSKLIKSIKPNTNKKANNHFDTRGYIATVGIKASYNPVGLNGQSIDNYVQSKFPILLCIIITQFYRVLTEMFDILWDNDRKNKAGNLIEIKVLRVNG